MKFSVDHDNQRIYIIPETKEDYLLLESEMHSIWWTMDWGDNGHGTGCKDAIVIALDKPTPELLKQYENWSGKNAVRR